MLGCLFSTDAAPSDAAELTNIEGRLTHYLADLLVHGSQKDQVWPAHPLCFSLVVVCNLAVQMSVEN